MNRKFNSVSITQISRHIIQLAAFIISPGLFILTFGAVGSILSSLVQGTFTLESQAASLVLVFTVFGVTILCGRFFCGFLCAFGSVQELIFSLPRLFTRRRRQLLPMDYDHILKYGKYLVLIFILTLCWIIGLSPAGSWNPWNVFGMYTSLTGWSSLTPWISVGGLLLVAIFVGSLFIERFFCRYLCPLGAMFALLSHFRLYRIRKKDHECNGCGLCRHACAMGIAVNAGSNVCSSECINCFKCLDHCPRHALKTDAVPAMSGLLTVLMIFGGSTLGMKAATALSETAATVSSEIQEEYPQAENPQANDDADDQGNSWDDSWGESEDGSGNNEWYDSGNESENGSGSESEDGSGAYQDGTYNGTGSGFRGSTEVEVTVSGGDIVDIQLVSTDDDMQWFQQAWQGVISSILSSQNPSVDAVSGATYSSNGILEAVSDALNVEFENNNDQIQDSHGPHHSFGA